LQYSIRLDAGGGAKSHEAPCEKRQGCFRSLKREHCAAWLQLDADQSALQRDVCAVPIDIGIVRGQALLGTSQSIFGTLQIDLFGTFGGFARTSRDPKELAIANNSEMRGFLHGIVIAELADPSSVMSGACQGVLQDTALPGNCTSMAFSRATGAPRDNHKLNGIRKHFRD